MCHVSQKLAMNLRQLRRAPVAGHAGRPSRLLGVVAFRNKSHDWDSQRSNSNSSSTHNSNSKDVGAASLKRDFLEARQVSLYELFDGNAIQLDVPEYQRPYAWRAKQVGR